MGVPIKYKAAFSVFVVAASLAVMFYLFPNYSAQFLIQIDRYRANFETHQVVVNGRAVRYNRSGGGDAVIVVHGLAANKDHWNRFSAALNGEYTIYAPDLPGFGDNLGSGYKDYSINAQVKWLRQFVDATGLDAFHIVGNSMGGTIAGLYAACYPDQVNSLVLLAPAGVASQKSELFQYVDAGKPNPLFVEDDGDITEVLDFLFYARPYIPRVVQAYETELARSRREHYQQIFNELYDLQKQKTLDMVMAGLQTPTLIIWGNRDRVLDQQGASVLSSKLADVRVEIMDATGHLPMIERPEEVARLFRNFLQQLDDGY